MSWGVLAIMVSSAKDLVSSPGAMTATFAGWCANREAPLRSTALASRLEMQAKMDLHRLFPNSQYEHGRTENERATNEKV